MTFVKDLIAQAFPCCKITILQLLKALEKGENFIFYHLKPNQWSNNCFVAAVNLYGKGLRRYSHSPGKIDSFPSEIHGDVHKFSVNAVETN